MANSEREFRLDKMTWEEAKSAIKKADFVALPCGSTEQHSLHLPLSVDTVRATKLTEELAKEAPKYDVNIIVLPVLPFGYSEHHMTFPGTITLSSDTYKNIIIEIGNSLGQHGASRFLLMNGHGGNQESLQLAADTLQRDHELPTHIIYWTDYARNKLEKRFGKEWKHAGEHETSIMEYYKPELVREEKKQPQTKIKSIKTRREKYFDETTKEGGYGDPTKSDTQFIARLIHETTDEILEDLSYDLK